VLHYYFYAGEDPIVYEEKVAKAKKTPGITFGGSLTIPTNTVDLTNPGFNNLGENPLIFAVMVSITKYHCINK